MKKYFKWVLFLALGITAGCIEKVDWVSDLYDDRMTEALIKSAPQNLLTSAQKLDFYRLPKPDLSTNNPFVNIPQDPNNPMDKAKVELGRLLFHEPGIARNPKQLVSIFTYSCASCHHLSAGFQAGRIQGIGEGGLGFGSSGEGRFPNPDYDAADLDVQSIRSPSVLNVAYQKVMAWNGRFGSQGINKGQEALWNPSTPLGVNLLGYEGVESRAIAALNIHRFQINQLIVTELGYKDRFDDVFGNRPEGERYTRETAGLAIAAFLRSLLPYQAPFQRWLRGENGALSKEEKRGALLFFGKAKCFSCHTGPTLSSTGATKFYALGMRDLSGGGVSNVTANDVEHKGRGGYTGNADDMYKFKVPQLYNLKDSPFYGHGGQFNTLREVIEYKNRGVPANQAVPSSQIASEFKPLGLTEEEIADLTAFISEALRDPELIRYTPEKLPSGLCYPNNDNTSKKDLGCQ